MIGIFLDDERNPQDAYWMRYPECVEWYTVRTYADLYFCICHMDSLNDVLISFDHDIQDFDLAGNELTGYDCLKSLVDFCIQTGKAMPKCMFHTQNPVGKKNMQSYYENYLKFVEGETQ